MKRLYRTEGRDATICGVCGGIAEFFGIDPTIVRVIAVLLLSLDPCLLGKAPCPACHIRSHCPSP